MTINYIILAHKNPNQLNRLIKILNTENCNFYIHIDKKSNIESFKKNIDSFKNVFFLPENLRVSCKWGDMSLVNATINCLKFINLKKDKSYTILLSGQEYPLKPNNYIFDFLMENYGKLFIATFPLINEKDNSFIDKYARERLTYYKINISSDRGSFVTIPSIFDKNFYKKSTTEKLKLLLKNNKFSSLIKLFTAREFNNNIKPFAGGQWWALPKEAVINILQFIKKNPNYLNYHKYTLVPDEIFFHSILIHINKHNFKKIKPSITYVNWERKNTTLPVTFNVNDFNELKIASENDKLFARKFDITVDEEILSKIDKVLLT